MSGSSFLTTKMNKKLKSSFLMPLVAILFSVTLVITAYLTLLEMLILICLYPILRIQRYLDTFTKRVETEVYPFLAPPTPQDLERQEKIVTMEF
jgi:hypothetical protein